MPCYPSFSVNFICYLLTFSCYLLNLNVVYGQQTLLNSIGTCNSGTQSSTQIFPLSTDTIAYAVTIKGNVNNDVRITSIDLCVRGSGNPTTIIFSLVPSSGLAPTSTTTITVGGVSQSTSASVPTGSTNSVVSVILPTSLIVPANTWVSLLITPRTSIHFGITSQLGSWSSTVFIFPSPRSTYSGNTYRQTFTDLFSEFSSAYSAQIRLVGSVICSSGSILSGSSCGSCPANTYNYFSGASSCATCPSGSTLVSSSLGCRPSSSSNAGPIDTSFYLSGSQTEGVSAFSSVVLPAGLTYYSSASSYPNAALVVASGSYVSTPLLSSLPTSSNPFTVSSWVKCDASSLTDANPSDVVVAWGAVGQVSTSTSLTAATLAVTSKERLNIVGTNVIGTVSTLSGGSVGFTDGTGTNAAFNIPHGVAVDSSGNVYVADRNNHRIRKVTPLGVATTLAGIGNIGSSDGTGTNAMFNEPRGIAIDSSGNLYVADRSNHRIRKVTPSGVVTTLAGSNQGYSDGTVTVNDIFRRFRSFT